MSERQRVLSLGEPRCSRPTPLASLAPSGRSARDIATRHPPANAQPAETRFA